MQPTSRSRCVIHGLALADDGGCVVCRRDDSPPEPPAARAGVLLGALGVAIVAATLGMVVMRAMPSPDPRPVAEVYEPAPRPSEGADGRASRPSPAAQTRPKTSPTAREAAPTSGAIADEMRRVPITVYSAPWCPSCRKAIAWLRANHYNFKERDVEADDSAQREAMRLNPRGSIPTIDVDGETIVGFSAQRLESAIRKRAERRVAR